MVWRLLLSILIAFHSSLAVSAEQAWVSSLVRNPVRIDNPGLAHFNNPQGIAVDSGGNIYVSDTGNHTIRRINIAGDVTTIAGKAGEAGRIDARVGLDARFNRPTGLSIGLGPLLVADTNNHSIRSIRLYDPGYGYVTTLSGTGTAGNDQVSCNFPLGVFSDSLSVFYIADTANHAIRKFDKYAVQPSTIACGSLQSSGFKEGWCTRLGFTQAQFSNPSAILVDHPPDKYVYKTNIYVADTANMVIRLISDDITTTPSQGLVTITLAGLVGQPGTADGSGSTSRFLNPSSMAFDRDKKNIYITDGHAIRKIDISKISIASKEVIVTTIAGGSQAGTEDGVGTKARFNMPTALAVDNSGNIYVADTGNHTIRKITSNGYVTTIAGVAGIPGSNDGMTNNMTISSGQCRSISVENSQALFGKPIGLARDPFGNLYVSDAYIYAIRKIDSSGLVSTFAGSVGQSGVDDGLKSYARFVKPDRMVSDSSGNIYVVDNGAAVRIITYRGQVATMAGNINAIPGYLDSNIGINARFSGISGLAVDKIGNIYVADSTNNAIRKISASGIVTTLAGGPYGMCGANFKSPMGVAVDSTGNVLVADTYNQTIRKITINSLGGCQQVSNIAGSTGLTGISDGSGNQARFNYPRDLSIDAQDNLYIADSNNSIRKMNSLGGVTTLQAGLPSLAALVVDPIGNVYITDSISSVIRNINSSGVMSVYAGALNQPGSADNLSCDSRLAFPTLESALNEIVRDGLGNLYITDKHSQIIRKIDINGVLSIFAGSPGEIGSTDGPSVSARFQGPVGLTIDRWGNIFVLDSSANGYDIRKISPSAEVSTVYTGLTLKPDPISLAIDSKSNIYYSASSPSTNQCGIFKISSTGVLSPYTGTAVTNSCVRSDGILAASQFKYPSGITIDTADNLYVAEAGAIRKIDTTSNLGLGYVSTILSSPSVVSSSKLNIDEASNLYLTSNASVMKYDIIHNSLTTIAGLEGQPANVNGSWRTARFYYPRSISLGPLGDLYVLDGDASIRHIDLCGGGETGLITNFPGLITTFAGCSSSLGTADGIGVEARFAKPFGIAVDTASNIYVADMANSTIRKINSSGVVTTIAGKAGVTGTVDGAASAARFKYPSAVAVDSANNIYVVDSGNHTVRRISNGQVSTVAGTPGVSGSRDGSVAFFNTPSGAAIDAAGNLYIADTENHTIRMIGSGGGVSTLAGAAGQRGTNNGFGSAARFSNPRGIVIDSIGNLYVTDQSNQVIRKINIATQEVTTFVGSVDTRGASDGASTLMYYPLGLAIDGANNIYVADSYNNTIRKITAQGVSSTIAGLALNSGKSDGDLGAARLAEPWGLAVAGNILYISDSHNHTIRKLQLP